jgi:lipooligosaccharide transport system permease protein
MKWIRHFHGMVATPLRPVDVFVGRLSWAALRITLSSSIFLVIATLLGGVPSPWAVFAVPSAVLVGMAFAAPLAAFSATQQDADVFPVVLRLGVIPLFLFSGVFFPLDQLPDWLEPVAWVTPLWHGVELARASTTGTLGALEAAGHVAVLLVFVLIGTWFGSRTFTRRLSP